MTNLAGNARDRWLLVTLENLLTTEQTDELRGLKAGSYWEASVQRGFASSGLSAGFPWRQAHACSPAWDCDSAGFMRPAPC